MKCVNIKLPGIKELVDTFGEIQTSKILDKFPDKIPSIEEASKYANSPEINYQLKAVSLITNNFKDIQLWIKQLGGLTDKFWEKVQQKLQIPKEQLELLRNSEGNTIEEKLLDFVSKYSYSVEVNTVKELITTGPDNSFVEEYKSESTGLTYSFNDYLGYRGSDGTYSDNLPKDAKYIGAKKSEKNTQYYSNLTVPGGTNYTENEISTPLITPSIKGHAQFSTDKGIGWFRSDDKENKVLGWKEEDDFLNSETAQYNPITKDDKIIFGHPTIGKSYLKQKGNNDFITLDDDYKDEVNAFVDANRGSETRQEYKGRKPKEYNEFMLNLFDRLKVQAEKEGKKLFVSNTNILKERMSEFDKVITIPKDEFKKRFDARGATYGFEDWKSDIDTTIAKVDKSKVISTTGYLSDLLEGNPKTRRILEVQSDLFQKGRDKKYLINGIPRVETGNLITEEEDIPFGNEPIKEFKDDVTSNKYKSNQFLQLLNKDNNWVKFFISAIIQDSIKKGYEKVLFPSGNTASKVEGHTTLEEFKKQKKDRIKELEKDIYDYTYNNYRVYRKSDNISLGNTGSKEDTESFFNSNNLVQKNPSDFEIRRNDESYIIKQKNNEITQLKQELERVETEGFGALKPIYNFYENTVTSVLKKQGYSPVLITDEYGNTWNEIEIKPEHNNTIFFQKQDNQLIKILKKSGYFGVKNDLLFIKKHFYAQASQLIAKYNRETPGLITTKEVNTHLGKNGNRISHVIINESLIPSELLQKSNENKEPVIKELNDKLQEIVEKLGFSIKDITNITDRNGNTLDVIAKLDMLNKIIEYTSGKADRTTLPEEVGHIFVELMGIQHPLVKKMLSEITSFDVYQEVLDEYSTNSYYQNEDGTPNELKLKKEAIGKMIAKKIVDNFNDSKADNNRKADNWVKAILAKIKELFRPLLNITGISKLLKESEGQIENPFEKTAEKILSGDISELNSSSNETMFQISNTETQLDKVKSILEGNSKIQKDETAETDRYTVNGEKGYTSATEISKKGFKNTTYEPTKEKKAWDDANQAAGNLTHAIAADYIAEEFPEYNKHVIRLTEEEKTKHKTKIDSVRKGLKKIVEDAKLEGTILISEIMVANTKTKRVGTIDILGIKTDGNGIIYDIKTRGSKTIYKTKLEEYGIQTKVYKDIVQSGDKTLGTLPIKIVKTRIIGVQNKFLHGTNVVHAIEFDRDKRGEIVGKPVGYEQTGISEIDNLLSKLNNEIELLEAKLKNTDKSKKELVKAQIEHKKNIVEEIILTQSVESMVKEAAADLRGIEDQLLSETFDPHMDFKEISDTLKLYAMLNKFIPSNYYKDKNAEDTKKIKKQLNYLVGTSEQLLKNLEDLIKVAIQTDVIDKTNIIGQGDIKSIDDVMAPQKNANIWKRWFTGISFSNHPLLIAVKKIVNTALATSRLKQREIEKEIIEKTEGLKKTGKNGLSLFDDLLQKYKDGTYTGDLVAEYMPEFYQDRYKAKQSKDKTWFNENTIFDKEKYEKRLESKKKLIKDLEFKEKQRIKQDILNSPKTKDSVKNNEDSLNYAVDNIYKKQAKEQLTQWIESNKDNIFEYNKPKDKWKDSRFTSLSGETKEYYDMYIGIIEEIREFLPQDIKRNFIPNFNADYLELVSRVGVLEANKLTKGSFISSLEVKYDEAQYGKRSSVTGETLNAIPVLGLNKIDAEVKSIDLSQNLMKFVESAYRFKELSAVENSVLMISNYVNGQEIIKSDVTGEAVLDKYNQIKTELNKNNAADQLKDYIDNVFYNKKRASDNGYQREDGKIVSLNKVGDNFLGYTAIKNLGLNLFAPVVNSLQGNITAIIEANRFGITKKDYLKAITLSATNDLKARLFFEKFSGALIGEFDNKEHKNLSVLLNKKIIDRDHAFSLMRIGEHQVQHDVMLALLLSGNYPIKFEDYEVKDGKLIWSNKDKKEPSIADEIAFEQRALKISKHIVGNNDGDDMMAIKKHLGGRALMQHRGWLPAMADSRFGAKRYDYDLEQWTEGRYRTIGKTLLKPLLTLIINQKNEFKGWNELSESDRTNWKSNFIELAMILGVVSLKAMLHGDDDDKKRRKSLAYLIRINSRLYSELTFFASLPSAYQILISPAASVSTLEDASKALTNTWQFIKEQDEKTAKKALKSDLKMIPPFGTLERAWNVREDFIDQ